jgi:hypothetical protein
MVNERPGPPNARRVVPADLLVTVAPTVVIIAAASDVAFVAARDGRNALRSGASNG